jgi:hypothetical protein
LESWVAVKTFEIRINCCEISGIVFLERFSTASVGSLLLSPLSFKLCGVVRFPQSLQRDRYGQD